MKKVIAIIAGAIVAFAPHSKACTSLIVAKGASADGSVMCTYCCDTWATFHPMYHFAAGKHPKGTMRKIIDRDTRQYHGSIPEAPETYNVIGNINEWQVTIGETTFDGRSEMYDASGIIDYGELMNLGLQRAKTAREAIKVMTNLAETYGYCSTGESFTICDPNEAWIMEMVGCGPKSKTVAWVAVRIPDNAICAHANQSRIHKFDQKDTANVMCSKNVVSYARKKGWYKGSDEDFSFCEAYSPWGFYQYRQCEGRVWSFFNRFADGMDKYLPYITMKDLSVGPLPFCVVPKHKLTVHDVEDALRDHYDGTPLAMDNDPGMGVWESPYRPSQLTYEVDGKKYFNERPVSTVQTAINWIGQMRSWLPRQVGGVLWYSSDDGKMTSYTPTYCCNPDVPECYKPHGADCGHFSMENAYWVENWVSNMVYPRFSLLFPTLKAVRDSLDASYFTLQPKIEAEALSLCQTDSTAAVQYLTKYANEKGTQMLERWKQLAFFLIMKYNDNVVRPDKNGVFIPKKEGFKVKFNKIGYDKKVQKEIVEQTGDRFLIPGQSKKK